MGIEVEIRCFVCQKLLKDYLKLVIPIHCKDSIVVATVAICEEDYEWVKNNPDAAVALTQSKLQALYDRETNGSND